MSPVRDAHEGSALCHLDGFLQVQGTGFLYKMVRHLTGVLIAVGEGVLPVETVTERLKVGNSTIPGVRASEAALAQHPVRTPMNDAWSASRHPPLTCSSFPNVRVSGGQRSLGSVHTHKRWHSTFAGCKYELKVAGYKMGQIA